VPQDRLKPGAGNWHGLGYQAAVLAQVATEVYSVERIKPLYERQAPVARLKLHNVIVRYADGSDGLPEAAPFDGIIMLPQLLPCYRRYVSN